MRKASIISMCIILVALVAMMVAADMALKPVKRDLAIARELTAELETRGDIQVGTKAVTIARKPEERHLAKDGWGMVVELQPSEAVCSRAGRLQKLAYRAAQSAGALYARGHGRPLEWFEIQFVLGKDVTERTLISVDAAGQLGRPEPPLPATWTGTSGS